VTAPALAGVVLHTADTARADTDRLRLTLTDAHEQLIDLYRRRAHVALGYGPRLAGWTAYLAAEFGDLLSVVPTPAQLAAMVDAGMSQREAAAPFRVSVGTVNAAVQSGRGSGAGAPTPAPDCAGDAAAASVPAHVRVAALVAAAGARGLTIPQAQRRTGWTYGATSGALSRAEARGLVSRPAQLEQRGGFRPYTATVPA
jgi:hypothetical protein